MASNKIPVVVEFNFDVDAFRKILERNDCVPIVRCKDCKHNRGVVTDMWGNPAVQCDYEIDYKPLDWYCAAGEKE